MANFIKKGKVNTRPRKTFKKNTETIPSGKKCYQCGGRSVQTALRNGSMVEVCKLH